MIVVLTLIGVVVLVAGMAYAFFRIGYQQGMDDAMDEVAGELSSLAMESHRREVELAKMEALIKNLKNNLYAEDKNAD